MPLRKRWFYIGLSWVLFLLYHLHPFVPPFFKTPGFLIGAALIGIICTLSYIRSGSIWLPVILHWLTVAVWLLAFGGLKKFSE
jgi:predicted Abi (CAAX) family protease